MEFMSNSRWNIFSIFKSSHTIHLILVSPLLLCFLSSIPHLGTTSPFGFHSCLTFSPVPSTWCATERHVSVLPWRRSTSRIWSLGTRSSRRLLRETSSPSQRTRSSSPCSAPLKLGDISAWSWNMLRVRESDLVWLQTFITQREDSSWNEIYHSWDHSEWLWVTFLFRSPFLFMCQASKEMLVQVSSFI